MFPRPVEPTSVRPIVSNVISSKPAFRQRTKLSDNIIIMRWAQERDRECVWGGVCMGRKEIDRQTDIGSQTGRVTDRQRQRVTDKQSDRDRGSQTDRETDTE